MKPEKTHKNGAAPKKRMPKWKRHTDEYRSDQLSRVKFATEDDIDMAIGIVWGGALTGMPFDLGGDGMSLIVPKAGIPWFTKAGLNFTEKLVIS
jgi:hypothetical protein